MTQIFWPFFLVENASFIWGLKEVTGMRETPFREEKEVQVTQYEGSNKTSFLLIKAIELST